MWYLDDIQMIIKYIHASLFLKVLHYVQYCSTGLLCEWQEGLGDKLVLKLTQFAFHDDTMVPIVLRTNAFPCNYCN